MNTLKTPAAVLKLALVIFRTYESQWAAYSEECDQAAKEGYRPHHCFHGMNLWTDYDPMCGPCEDGYGYFDPNMYRELALGEANRAFAAQNERIDMLVKLLQMGAPVQTAEMGTWATAPVQAYYPKESQKSGYAALAATEPQF